MYSYSVFGGTLHSPIAIPELRAGRGVDGDWTLEVHDEPSPSLVGTSSPEPILLGTDRVDLHAEVRAHAVGSGFRLDYDDTGVFDVSAGGRVIRWWRPPRVDEAIARQDLIGRVLAMALHAGGRLALHASGVALDGRAIAFLAPKGSGKSTLALALTLAGGELLTDDTLPVEGGSSPRAWPGVHSVRLFADSASRLQVPVDAGAEAPDKHTWNGLDAARVREVVAPLDAIYLLEPATASTMDEVVRRTRLAGVPAAVELVRHAKIGALLGRREAGLLLDRAVAVASVVPIYRLEVLRTLDRLDEVVEEIGAWHLMRAPRTTRG